MKLSEAIRLGAMLKPQARNAIYDGRGTCALGAALDAISGLSLLGTPPWTGDPYVQAEAVVTALDKQWATVIRTLVVHPRSGDSQYLGNVVADLNDVYGWTREAIADWVETIEAQQDQPAPLRVTELAEVV